jgi:hypothetical protein
MSDNLRRYRAIVHTPKQAYPVAPQRVAGTCVLIPSTA